MKTAHSASQTFRLVAFQFSLLQFLRNVKSITRVFVKYFQKAKLFRAHKFDLNMLTIHSEGLRI